MFYDSYILFPTFSIEINSLFLNRSFIPQKKREQIEDTYVGSYFCSVQSSLDSGKLKIK